MRRTKSTTTPAKKAAHHNQLSPVDVDNIINSLISSPVPSTPKSSPKKRKTTLVVSDDDTSGIEVVDGPHPSPKKARPATPPPGSAAFEELPAVSFSDMPESHGSLSASITFGTTTRSTRSKVKTEKGALLEELKASRKSRVKNSTSKAETPGSALEGNHLVTKSLDTGSVKGSKTNCKPPYMDTLDVPIDADVEMSPSSSNNKLHKKRSVRPNMPSDDELPEVSDLMLSTPTKKKNTSKTAGKMKSSRNVKDLLDLEAVESGNDSMHSETALDNYLATDDDGSVGDQSDNPTVDKSSGDEVAPNSSDNENIISHGTGEELHGTGEELSVVSASDNPDDVTSTAYQDRSITQIYHNLPHLDALRPIIPYRPSSTSARFTFSIVAPLLKAVEVETLLKALMFTKSDFYVNFARINPNLLRSDGGRIRMARPDNAAAVGLYTGMCTRGAILDVDHIGPPQAQYEVHGISVAGTNQDTRRQMAVMGMVLDYDSITGNMSELGMSFYTRGQGKNGNYLQHASHHTGHGTTHVLSPLISSVVMPGSTNSSRGFPASRSFDNRVPVYDGRAGHGRQFTFSDADFKELSSWPLYGGGNIEVEPETMVSVGHTIGSYKGINGGLFLSMNVHFVIVLGKPAIGL